MFKELDYLLFFNLSLVVFLVTALLSLVFLLFKKKVKRGKGHDKVEESKSPLFFAITFLFIIGILLGTFGYIVRWDHSGFMPLSNTYETMLFFSVLVPIIGIVLYKFDKQKIITFAVSLGTVVALAGASFFADTPRPLVPALRSNWLIIHVSFMFISYSAFFVSFLIALIYLFSYKKSHDYLHHLEGLAYKVALFGLPFLTLGVFTGAVWAQNAWGRYWGWDPKETWSAITWLYYAVYFHVRFLAGWTGKRSIWLLVLGFLFVLFTYFGVNYLLSGLHSYSGN